MLLNHPSNHHVPNLTHAYTFAFVDHSKTLKKHVVSILKRPYPAPMSLAVDSKGIPTVLFQEEKGKEELKETGC